MLRRERGLQPASARLAAGEQHHAGALLLPFGDILTQRLQPALIGHRGPGTKGDGLVRRKAAKVPTVSLRHTAGRALRSLSRFS